MAALSHFYAMSMTELESLPVWKIDTMVRYMNQEKRNEQERQRRSMG